MYDILNKGRVHNLSVSVVDLFDKIIIPMLTYGSEIWSGVLIEHMNRGVFQSPVGTIVPSCT
jgi:hypothetical protein